MNLKYRIPLLSLLLIALTLFLAVTFSFGEASVGQDHFVYLPVTIDFTDLLFRDKFDDPHSGWPVDDDGDVRWSYQNGEYEMLIRDSNRWAGALVPVNGLDTYNVRASMRRLQGSTSDYGLVFDWKDWDNFYYLVMDPSGGWFGVAKVVKGDPKIVIPRTDTTVIQPGNGTNRLRIDRNGQEIAVSINGIRFPAVQDKEFEGGVRVGFYMESDDVAPAITRYDDVEVWRLENDSVQSMEMQQMEHPAASGVNSFSGLMGNAAHLFE